MKRSEANRITGGYLKVFQRLVLDIANVKIDLSGIVVIVGNYGSGKTEVAINLAMDQKHRGRQVCVVDLDLVNPYFRTREVRRTFQSLDIQMVLPPEGLLQADLPVLAPQVAGAIRNPGELTILDVGGDDVGASVLAVLRDALNAQKQEVRTLQVVNPFRPKTDTVDGCLRMKAAIEATARLAVDGWIGNAHLLDETLVDHILQGYGFMQKLVQASGLPLELVAIDHELLASKELGDLDCPLLPIRRQLVPPWKKTAALSSDNPMI